MLFDQRSSFPHNHGGFQHIRGLSLAYYFGVPEKPENVVAQSVQRFEVRFLLFSIEQRKGQAPCPQTMVACFALPSSPERK